MCTMINSTAQVAKDILASYRVVDQVLLHDYNNYSKHIKSYGMLFKNTWLVDGVIAGKYFCVYLTLVGNSLNISHGTGFNICRGES